MQQMSTKQALDARNRLISISKELTCPLKNSQIDSLLAYVELLSRWNRRIRLVGSRDVASVIDIHLTDAMALGSLLRNAEGPTPLTLIDVGSGAGLPGLILSLIVPGIRISLCETSEKRVTFLEEARRKLAVDVEILHRDVKSLESPSYHHAVARAVFEPESWFELAKGLIAPGGTIWLMLTQKQLRSWPHGGEVTRYRVGGDRERALVAQR